MWVDYRGSLSTVYNDGEISTLGQLQRSTQYYVSTVQNIRLIIPSQLLSKCIPKYVDQFSSY